MVFLLIAFGIFFTCCGIGAWVGLTSEDPLIKKKIDEDTTSKEVKNDAKTFIIFEFVSDGDISVERGAEKLGMSVPDFIKAMHDNGFSLPSSKDSGKLK